MADVKWIKIVTDIFDDEKMLLIESLPGADSLIVIWFKLLCLAGKNNNNGVFLMNDKIPYTEEMLSTIFRRDINTIRLALKTFEEFGMIEIIDGVITIPNWGKHQTLDSYEKKKERDRLYQEMRRAKQKEIAEKSSDKSSDVAISDKEEDKDKDINNIYSQKNSIDYQEIINLYHENCPSLPKVTKITDARKKLINARLKDYTIGELVNAFAIAEGSDFLTGRNGKWGGANFDWIMNTNNIVKILEGNYKNKTQKGFDGNKGLSTSYTSDFFAQLEYETKHKGAT